MKRWILWGALALLILAAGAWAASRMIVQVSANLTAEQKSMASTGKNPPVDNMQQKLMDPKLDPAARESLMEKIDLAQKADADQKAGETGPAPKAAPDFGSQPQSKVMTQVETGIFPGSEGMIRPSQAQINNYWQGLVGGQIVMVFAGASAEDPNQGLVVVVTTSADPNVSDIQFKTVTAPGASGSLRVVDEGDGVIRLQNPQGIELRFDRVKFAFIP
jgi:hypothetical protein